MLKPTLLLISIIIIPLSVTATHSLTSLHRLALDLSKKKHSVDEYTGKAKSVIVNAWCTDCPPCINEISVLQSIYDDHKPEAAIVFAIALNFPGVTPGIEKEVLEFAEDDLINFPVLLSNAQSISSLGGSLPKGSLTSLLFSPNKKLETVTLGQLT